MRKWIIGILCVLSAISATAVTTVSTFTGGDVGEGLDFSGEFVYAVNVAGNMDWPPLVQGLSFSNETQVAGVTLTIGGTPLYAPWGWGTGPYYGDTGNDTWMGVNGMMHATALSYGIEPNVQLDLDVITGRTYELQLLFSENSYKTANARTFDIIVDGLTISDNFTPIPVGAEWTTAPHTGVAVTYEFTAADSVCNVVLTNGDAFVQAFTLKDVSPPAATVTTFTGGDPGEGLAFTNDYLYAVNIAGNMDWPPLIQGVSFSNETQVAGVTLTIGGTSLYAPWGWGTGPYYGDTGNDTWLGANAMMHATALSYGTDPNIKLDLAVTAGKDYELQLLFSENAYANANERTFDILLEGATIAENFTTIPEAAAGWTTAPDTGVLVTYQFTAADDVASVVLTNGVPLIQGLLLEDLTPPPPPPKNRVVWENDMSADPVGDGWSDRAASVYTISDGVLTMDASGWSTILDTAPDNEFTGTTIIDLEWKATTVDAAGAGIWLNAGNDTDTYGSLRFDAVLAGDNTQTVTIFDQDATIATISGLSSGMLSLHALIDSEAKTISYEVSDGSVTEKATVAYTEITLAGQAQAATLFTAGTGAVVDYVKIIANVELGFESWAAEYGLVDADALPETDVEPDGMNNLMEYAMGGNPTNDDHAVIAPGCYTVASGETTWFYHIHSERTDDPYLSFGLATKTDLSASSVWDTNDVVAVGESAAVNEIKSVTNRTEATTDQKFIQMSIDK